MGRLTIRHLHAGPLAALAGLSWHRSQAEARREALAGEVTASWPVQVRREGLFAFHGIGMQDGQVSVRGEFIEVAHTWSVARTLNRGEFYFPARQTELSVESGAFGREQLDIKLAADGIAVSVDSFRPETLRFAVSAGAAWLNDIHGFGDPGLYPVLAALQCRLVVMHAVQDRADYIRTHDVAAARDALTFLDAITREASHA